MSIGTFIRRQVKQCRQGGAPVLLVKARRLITMLPKLPVYVVSLPLVLFMRAIRPWLLIRLEGLVSTRIGHFAANTELYLCERDAMINTPKGRYLDLFYLSRPICNQQLATMWRRVLHIWPDWILGPVARMNKLLPGGSAHVIGQNTQNDRDVHNLLDRFPCHLEFTPEEEAKGGAVMARWGIPENAPFVCLTVRDSAYLDHHIRGCDWQYHNYRDSNIQNYVLAVEALAEQGYYVFRMGARVHEAIEATHSRVIDYAMNGMRSDFMDIWLGAHCEFCVSVGTGFDAVPLIFRRPIAYVNMVPAGYLFTFRNTFVGIFKHYLSVGLRRELSLSDIFARGVGHCFHSADYEAKGVELVENTPEEIRDVVIEMADRLNGNWHPDPDDELLQHRFWEIFPADAVDAYAGKPLHGKIRGRFGAVFLRNNPDWLR